MKQRRHLFAILLFAGLSGCSTPHIIELTDGSIIQIRSEPTYNRKENTYSYKTVDGKAGTVSGRDVKKIEEI